MWGQESTPALLHEVQKVFQRTPGTGGIRTRGRRCPRLAGSSSSWGNNRIAIEFWRVAGGGLLHPKPLPEFSKECYDRRQRCFGFENYAAVRA
jgi:hypothetical protein